MPYSPNVDDGARDINESLAMLAAAYRAGITQIVCTPHARDPYFDYNAMWDAFEALRRQARGFSLTMGFEVNIAKLWELGSQWIPYLAFDGTGEFLLELQTNATAADFARYERTIYEIQGQGYQVIIAHPERYRAIQKRFDRRKPRADGLQAAGEHRLRRRRPVRRRKETREEALEGGFVLLLRQRRPLCQALHVL